MDAFLSRPHKRPSRQKIVAVGGPGNPADFIVAIRNIEAELLCAFGTPLQDKMGSDLPSILDERTYPRKDSAELLEAVRVMRGLAGPMLGAPPVRMFPSPFARAWDLDGLMKVFEKAIMLVAPQATRALHAVCDETDTMENRIMATDPASRALCLWSSLLHLAGACAILKIRYRTRRDRPTGDA